jgi:protein involved in polysaccharide export with SLBB domain
MTFAARPHLLLVAAFVALAACAWSAPVRADEVAASEPYVVGPGDVLEIMIHPGGQAEAVEQTATVGSDGVINVVHVGGMKVGGLTPNQISSRIKGNLVGAQVFLQPFVSVNVKEYLSQGVNVSGAVSKQGRFYLKTTTTLIDILSMAEGIDEEKAGTVVVITRPGSEAPLRIQRRDLFSTDANKQRESNIRILAGDNVHVPIKAQFCVSGAVKAPDCYPLEDPVPLSQALAMAGGVDSETADRANVVVRRPDGTEQRLDLDALERGGAPAPIVQADDQVVVGTREKTRFCIRGEVKKEDCYEYELGLTLDGAISKAGGFIEDTADRSHVEITRVEGGKPVQLKIDFTVPGEAGARFTVLRDDVINVLKRDCLVTVQGSVKTPAQYALKTGMTVSDAIAAAGGVYGDQRWGNLSDVTLTREGQAPQSVNVKKVLAGKGTDVQLQCGDRVFVKPRKM